MTSKLITFELAKKIAKISEDKINKHQTLIKEFAMRSYYLNIALDEAIGPGLTWINKDLIDQIINSEIALREQKQAMLKTG